MVEPWNKDSAELLKWLGKEDSSLYGECGGPALDTLVAAGFAEVQAGNGTAALEYRRVILTPAGIARLEELRRPMAKPGDVVHVGRIFTRTTEDGWLVFDYGKSDRSDAFELLRVRSLVEQSEVDALLDIIKGILSRVAHEQWGDAVSTVFQQPATED